MHGHLWYHRIVPVGLAAQEAVHACQGAFDLLQNLSQHRFKC